MKTYKLYTSYFKNKNTLLHQHYVKSLIPEWFKQNSIFFKNTHIYTDCEKDININNINKINISASDAKIYDDDLINIMSTQIGVWLDIFKNLNHNEVAIYLDPDAFIYNSKILNVAEKSKDILLTKKRNPYGRSDAGIAIFNNTKNTLFFFNTLLQKYSANRYERCIIEYTYDELYGGNNNYFISWKDINILLRGELCGNDINQIDCIHGIKCSEDGKLEQLIKIKEQLRSHVY